LGVGTSAKSADSGGVESFVVECLACGELRHVLPVPWRKLQADECHRCGYLGWARTVELTELMRRGLRERPLERRRIYAL
jgi:hypothetical protein